MRKLLLAIFLLSISSNAFAKVEIWECENGSWNKIDTSIPMVYYRHNGQWKQKYYKENGEELKYDEENNTIVGKGFFYDLITKQLIIPWKPYKLSCEVIG